MRARNRTQLVAVNLIVWTAVAAAVFFIWNRGQDSTAPTPTTSEEPRSTASELPATSAAPSTPSLYAVQEGDTLLAIAEMYSVSVKDLAAVNDLPDPNVLHVGQTLIVPVGTPPSPTSAPSAEASLQPSATVTPPPTLTPSGPPLVEIDQVLHPDNLAAEVMIVSSQGGMASLDGWTLSDGEGNTFTFPAISLFTDTRVRVHSTSGAATPSDLYWSRTESAWSAGELIRLRDAAGHIVDTYIVP